MPDKPLTIATYAAGAGLAAITLVYVFGPTFLLDDEAAVTSKSSRKKGVVGLYNPANDCFINSVLQTLAGLPELRTYLIRELHRRRLDGKEIYSLVAKDDDAIRPNEGKDIVEMKEVKEPDWKVLGMQQGLVTAGLKHMLDALNERPIVKKTISAREFVHVLEQAFRTRISRQQQDAQEFLQIVTERLSEEYYAGRTARRKARSMKSRATLRDEPVASGSRDGGEPSLSSVSENGLETSQVADRPKADIDQIREGAKSIPGISEPDLEEDPSFPFEGKIESQIECLHCHFKPKPSVSSFVTLTLNVPTQQSATSLNSCFDGMLKVEHIDDFKCEYCRLQHALEIKRKELPRSTSERQTTTLESDIAAIEYALAHDPEDTSINVKMPDSSSAPKRRIARHMRISTFPRVLAIHLSRSVWDPNSSSSKNLAKVSFPETLPLGGILDQKSYRLLGVVTHKGGHNSGHYESFRRQFLAEPYSAHVSMGTQGVFSARASPASSVMPSPRLSPHTNGTRNLSPPSVSTSSPSSASLSSSQIKIDDSGEYNERHPDDPPRNRSVSERVHHKAKSLDLARQRRKIKRDNHRWWRISDDKIKESTTKDVLGMQREVYLLFYEIALPDS
ncbi:hypothetical protein BDV97DRAFT_356763 [Delphinella strobiligena]|nr:hypothetical protein BDV97DRAFT_356763 [Delphinella strobiligena]